MREMGRNPYWPDATVLSEAEEIEAGLFEALGASADDATPELVEAWLDETASQLTPAESMSVENALRDIGRRAKELAGQALPAVGTVVGTAYGGPVGGAIGSKVGGSLAKSLLAKNRLARRHARHPHRRRRHRRPGWQEVLRRPGSCSI